MGKQFVLGAHDLNKGVHELNFDLNRLAISAGLYNLSITNGDKQYTVKLIITE
jgi:hypothetical protein